MKLQVREESNRCTKYNKYSVSDNAFALKKTTQCVNLIAIELNKYLIYYIVEFPKFILDRSIHRQKWSRFQIHTKYRHRGFILHGKKNRGTQREYSSKPLKHSIVKRILVLKR